MRKAQTLGALASIIIAVIPSAAQAITPAENQNPAYFATQYGAFIGSIEARLAPLLSTASQYGQVIYFFLTGVSVIYAVYHLGRYVTGNANVGVLLEKGIYLIFVWGLMGSYATVTSWIFNGFTQLAEVMQASILSDGKMFGPAIFLFQVANSLIWTPATVFTAGLSVISLYLSTIALGLLLTLAAALVSAWPIVGYFVAKIVGLALIPTLLIPQLSSLFDGWLRLLFGFALYTLVGRATLVAIVLIAEQMFHATYGAAVPTSILGAIDSIQDVIVANMFFLFGIAFLAATSFTVGKITGGGAVNAGVGAAINAGSKLLAGAIV